MYCPLDGGALTAILIHRMQTTKIEPFVEYATLLDTQLALHASLPVAQPEAVPAIRADIAAVAQDMAALAVLPGLAQSALRCGTAWAYEVSVLQKNDHAATPDDAETRQVYGRRLRQAVAFITRKTAEQPSLAEDHRLDDIQDALGGLAADTTVASQVSDKPHTEQPRSVDYAVALDLLRANLAALQDGEHYALSPAQVATLADPTMSWSRWQRHRFLRLAMQTLTAEGYVCVHNGGRGRSSRYTLGAPSRPQVLRLAA